MKQIKRTIEDEAKTITREVRGKTLAYITAGFGFVAGLAWNEAIKGLIEYLFPLAQDTLFVKFVYAALVTIAVAALGVYLGRIVSKGDEDART